MKSENLQAGFTLIELLVVITILGLLATLYVSKVVPAGEKAKRDLTVVQMTNLDQAIQHYKVDMSRYPESLQDLMVMPNDVKTDQYRAGGYLKEIPADGWKNSFIYRRLREPKGFEIISYGADGKEGGEGYDADIVK